MHTRLTPEEDAELRRLAALTAYGELGERPTQLYAELRGRDRRRIVRPVHALAVPLCRASRADGPRAAREV